MRPDGGIELVLQLIRRQHGELELAIQTGEEAPDFAILELCWTFLWNITDETPANVENFLDHGGLDIMVASLELFPQEVPLRRNAMGLVTNIAEVDEFISCLVTERVMRTLQICIESEDSGLEVTYNVAGTL